MWKAGCLTAVLGLILSAGSFVFFGTAIKKAVTSREVWSEVGEAGLLFESRDIQVDADGQIQVQITATVELSENLLSTVDAGATIEQSTATVWYEVRDETGDVVYHESGMVEGSTIVPSRTSSHRETFDRSILSTFRGARFDPPEFGVVRVITEVPETDDSGNKISDVRVTVFDQIPGDSSAWAWGGVLSMLAGPFVVFVGLVVFVIGLLTRRKSAASSA